MKKTQKYRNPNGDLIFLLFSVMVVVLRPQIEEGERARISESMDKTQVIVESI